MFKIRDEKLRLTDEEEFKILTLIMDKFLWIATFLLLLGIYEMIYQNIGLEVGLAILASGVFMLLVFTSIVAHNIEANFGND